MEQPAVDAPAGGRTRRRSRWLLGAALVVLAAVIALHAAGRLRHASPLPNNFAVVEPGRLYRSGQPTAEQFANLIQRYGIRTVLNLRNPARETDYVADEPLVEPHGARVVRLPITSTAPPDSKALAALRKLYADPSNYPILVHCEHGVARTGVAVCIWRIERQGWDQARAVEDMVASGYPIEEHNAPMREMLLRWRAPEEAAKPDAP